MGIDEAIPPHIRQNISTGEEIISAFRGNYKRKSKSSPKNWSNCLMVLTTEKLLIDSEKKKTIEKLFLNNVLSTEHEAGKTKIKLFYSPRDLDAKEDVITLDIMKKKGENKEEYNKRMNEINQNIEVFFESAEEKTSPEQSKSSFIPDQIIKPKSPVGVPYVIKDTTPEREEDEIKIFCHNCGEKLPQGGTFCAKCGTKIG